MNVNLEMSKLESILIENPKFSKRWLEMLNNHKNGCPCKHFGYTNLIKYNDMDDLTCPFNIKKYSENCFSCEFSRLLYHKSSKVWHLKNAINNVLETRKINMTKECNWME